MRSCAIVNVSAGSVPEDAVQLLGSAEAELGHGVVFSPDDDLPPNAQIRKMVQQELDAVIVWGGDGTVAAVLAELSGNPMPVLVLPGGHHEHSSQETA